MHHRKEADRRRKALVSSRVRSKKSKWQPQPSLTEKGEGATAVLEAVNLTFADRALRIPPPSRQFLFPRRWKDNQNLLPMETPLRNGTATAAEQARKRVKSREPAIGFPHKLRQESSKGATSSLSQSTQSEAFFAPIGTFVASGANHEDGRCLKGRGGRKAALYNTFACTLSCPALCAGSANQMATTLRASNGFSIVLGVACSCFASWWRDCAFFFTSRLSS